MNRKWLPTIGELIDRLSIYQLKEVFLPENKEKYIKEMEEISHDIDLILKENNVKISANLIHIIIILAQINTHIWNNESKARKGIDQDNSLLKLTHGLNGIRNSSVNYILDIVGLSSRKDFKIDCLAEEFKEWDINLLNSINKDEKHNN